MSKRIQQEKATVKHETEEVVDDVAPPPDTAKAQELKSEMDDILDEIDSVLEKNAEEFVNAYVQKGGE